MDGPIDRSIKVYPTCKPPKRRRATVVEGITTKVAFNVHQDDVYTLTRAVNERVFNVKDAETGALRKPYQPKPQIFEQRLGSVRKLLLQRLSPTPVWKIDDVVNQYHGKRRTIYAAAAAVLKTRAVNLKDAHIRGFGKPEKTNVSAKPDAVQRIISPRHPVYNLAVGCYLKAFEHKIYLGIKRLFGENTIAKGLNAVEVAQLMYSKFHSFDDPVAIGIDAKRFDQHVSLDALLFEHSVYNQHFKDSRLKELLDMQLYNRVTIRCANGRIKYTTRGTRMSGDMNTALGNCLLMCLMMYGFREHIQVPFKLINNGDDCVIFCDKSMLLKVTDNLHDYFKDFGFEMVTEQPVHVFEQVEFCQTRPVFNGIGYVACRDPRITQSKDAISLQPFATEKYFRSWIGTVGRGGLALTAGLPIVQEYYQCMIRNGSEVELKDKLVYESGLFKYGSGLNQSYREITTETRVSFWKAFGILPDLQRAREDYLSQVKLDYSYALDETGFEGHPNYFGSSSY